ncbi:MAG: hypothetical protein COB04_05825 [Gammaproteobacteria bacterium]|nr:MAG: hypothetical protein COB04_05825 [Gammaproteobacteria bacterium]
MQSTNKQYQPATQIAEEIFSADLYPGDFQSRTTKAKWQAQPEYRDSRFIVISLDLIRNIGYQLDPNSYDHVVFNFQYDEDITSDDIAYFIRLKSIIREHSLSYTTIGMSSRCIQFLELLGIDSNLEFIS